MTKTFEITANGTPMGEYRAEDKEAAINACCVDAGYDDLADSLAVTGGSSDEFNAFEIDTDELLSAVETAAGESVFEDSYGSGVALVRATSYATYRELAEAFDLDIELFYA